MYLSLSTLSSNFSIILRVVSTPISDVIKASSISSNTNSSMVDLPATAREILLKKFSFVFCKPASSFSFFVSSDTTSTEFGSGITSFSIISSSNSSIRGSCTTS